MKEKQGANMVAVTLMAAAAGAGVALLTAPRSGRETRARLKSQAAQAKLKAKQRADSLKHVMDQKISRGKEMKEAVTQSYKDTKANLANDAQDSKEQIKSSIINNWEEKG
ncbi:MAG: YtxH-like protein [Candidatus Saccharibacteria bacterium]|nr:YtxH-like protein [Candidatus Saccharibacteria bacterium]